MFCKPKKRFHKMSQKTSISGRFSLLWKRLFTGFRKHQKFFKFQESFRGYMKLYKNIKLQNLHENFTESIIVSLKKELIKLFSEILPK